MYYNIHSHKLSREKDTLTIISSELSDNSSFYSIGVHPWNIGSGSNKKLSSIETIADNLNILAIGEIGLDKACITDFELQKAYFVKQLEVAVKHRKPVIIHCVKAFDEVLCLTMDFKLPLIMHGFNRGYKLAEQFLKRGFYLSFGKSLFDERSNCIETFEKTPLSRIFLETDESEFTIQEMYKKAAQIRKITVEALTGAIENNFMKVFNGLK